MVPELRKKYNDDFKEENYLAYINDLANVYPGHLDFRVAETPVFVSEEFTEKMLSACEAIIDVITTPGYHQQSEKAIPEHLRVPNEDAHPHFIAFDFGICTGAGGLPEPQLIEMQGFPSLFAYQILYPEVSAQHFHLPTGYTNYLNGFNKQSYIALL